MNDPCKAFADPIGLVHHGSDIKSLRDQFLFRVVPGMRAEFAPFFQSRMSCDRLMGRAVVNLHQCVRDLEPYLLPDKPIGHRVEIAHHLDVAVSMHFCGLVLGTLKGDRGEGNQSLFLFRKALPAGESRVFHPGGVEFLEIGLEYLV